MPAEGAGLRARVSPETAVRLEIYADLLRKWNPKINLVARSTLGEVWERHFADSAQVLDVAAPASGGLWVDLGSGGGFPGAVVAILAAEEVPDLDVVCVESDQRKAAFLRTVSRETSVPFEVISERIEVLDPFGADFLSARALAPLTDLLPHAERHLKTVGLALFPKGERHAEELAEAQNHWRFSVETATSSTDPKAVIFKFGAVRRASVADSPDHRRRQPEGRGR